MVSVWLHVMVRNSCNGLLVNSVVTLFLAAREVASLPLRPMEWLCFPMEAITWLWSWAATLQPPLVRYLKSLEQSIPVVPRHYKISPLGTPPVPLPPPLIFLPLMPVLLTCQWVRVSIFWVPPSPMSRPGGTLSLTPMLPKATALPSHPALSL